MVIQKSAHVILMSLIVSIFFFSIYYSINTVALSKACENSADCKKAAEDEERAEAAANEASLTASAYEREVTYKNHEIAQKTAEIASTRTQIDKLIKEINEKEAKLTSQQTTLAKLLISHHFDKNSDPVLIFAGSNTISELAEREARETTINTQIAAANEDIIKIKSELEKKRQQEEDNLSALELAERELEATKRELEALVEKYENDAATYEKEAEKAREAMKEAERAEQEAHPELYRVGSYYGAFDSYEWQNYCPEYQDYFSTYIDGYSVGGYVCECVSYVGWKAYEQYGLYLSWGNANTWDDYGRASYVVDNIPSPNSIGQFDGASYYGHVWWVESVNDDGSINVTEYNNAYATYLYTGDYHYGDFGARTIPAWEASGYTYIHLDQPL